MGNTKCRQTQPYWRQTSIVAIPAREVCRYFLSLSSWSASLPSLGLVIGETDGTTLGQVQVWYTNATPDQTRVCRDTTNLCWEKKKSNAFKMAWRLDRALPREQTRDTASTGWHPLVEASPRAPGDRPVDLGNFASSRSCSYAAPVRDEVCRNESGSRVAERDASSIISTPRTPDIVLPRR